MGSRRGLVRKWIRRALIALVALVVLAVAAIKLIGAQLETPYERYNLAPPGVRETPEPGDNAEYISLASHHGAYTDRAVVWTTRLIEDNQTWNSAKDVDLTLVRPLPAATEVVGQPPPPLDPVEPVRDAAGRIVAFRLPSGARLGGEAQIALRYPVDTRAELRPPLLAGRVIQRVTLDGAHFEPAPSGPVRRFPGYMAQRGLRDAQIDWCDDTLEMPDEMTGGAVYLRPDAEFVAAGGLAGRLVLGREHRRSRLLIFGAGFAALALLMGAVFVALERKARFEEADAFLENL